MKACAMVAAVALCGCFPRGPALEGDADPDVCDEEFDDHTQQQPFDGEQVDFIVTSVTKPDVRRVRFEEPGFYDFHDEWYWFRLLNGVSACASSASPEDLGPFENIDAIYAFLEGRDEMPLDLARTADGRLVSPSFYDLSLRTTPRAYAPGTLFHPIDTDGWAFEVAFIDNINSADLHSMHAAVEATLPLGERLFWRAVSPDHGALADAIEADTEDPLHDRVLRLGEEPDAPACCASTTPDTSVALAIALALLYFASVLRRVSSAAPRTRASR